VMKLSSESYIIGKYDINKAAGDSIVPQTR
jgi:hypothetical protein